MQYPYNWYTDAKNNMFSLTDTATIKNDKLYVIQSHHYVKSPKYQTYKPFRRGLIHFNYKVD